MTKKTCQRCGASDYVRNGNVRQLQRYLCKSCGCHCTDTPPRGKPPAMKALAVLFYSMCHVSFGSIARLLDVSDVAVMQWIRAEAQALPEPHIPSGTVTVTLDEMWHFLKKRHRNYGFGERMILWEGEPWPGCWVGVMMRHAHDSSTKSGERGGFSSPMTGKGITGLSPRHNSSLAKP
jgi:transposase-like protein